MQPEDKLKALFSIANNFMNETSSRIKGVTIFNKLVFQIQESRLHGYQDCIQSSLHLMAKSLDLPLVLTTLGINPYAHCLNFLTIEFKLHPS